MSSIAALIDAFSEAALAFRTAVVTEMQVEDAKPLEKSAAIFRIMGTENPETKKPHSASSAEKIVEGEPQYEAFLRSRRKAVFEKLEASAALDAARFRVQAAIATINAQKGVA